MAEEIRVAILEQKMEDLKDIIVKIDNAIEKLSEVNSNVSKMLAVHEERIAKQEESDNILFTKIDKLSDKVDRDYDSIVSRVSLIERRVWMAIGVVSCLTFLMNTKVVQFLTPSNNTTIMEMRNKNRCLF